jgi:small subunit ribosomal protein S1
VHISELAPHHVENPREVVQQGQAVNVRVLEIDGERRRLSLSLKRVEEGEQPVPRADGGESVHTMPDLKLSEEAFPSGPAASVEVADEVVEETEAGEAIGADVEEAVDAELEPEAHVETVSAEPEAGSDLGSDPGSDPGLEPDESSPDEPASADEPDSAA